MNYNEINMKLADENGVMFADDEESLADRKLFVHNFGIMLSQTREQIVSAGLDDNEIVTVRFGNGYEKYVNVNMDSYSAIMRDILKNI